jgi:saccharopine dehydrogenase (NAD+, L-lysine-forming)
MVSQNEKFGSFFKSRMILAGRSEAKLKELSDEVGLSYRVFNLEEEKAMDEALADIRVVIHMAGPFIRTALPMLKGCIRNQCHYLDITGGILRIQFFVRK